MKRRLRAYPKTWLGRPGQEPWARRPCHDGEVLNRRKTHRKQGLTLLEVMVAVSLLATVFLAIAFIESETAKQTLALYGDARTLARAHLAMERIRYKLAEGEGYSGVVLDSGRTLEFRNPNLTSGTISSFKFLNGKVFYRSDKNSGPVAPLQGIGLIDDLVFDNNATTNSVRVTVTTRQRYSWKLGKPFRLTTEITFRNVPYTP